VFVIEGQANPPETADARSPYDNSTFRRTAAVSSDAAKWEREVAELKKHLQQGYSSGIGNKSVTHVPG
jgi:hypothetical protein